jgi:hypothetical protein
MAKQQRWEHIRQLVNDGANLEINGGGYGMRIASLYLDEQQVCMFHCAGMDFDAIMDRLEELSQRFNDEGIVTDEINGSTYTIE